MKTYNNRIKISDYTKNKFANYTFLKIETTGLSKFTDSIFMIATLDVKNEMLNINYISNLKEEFDLIHTLSSKNYITFNGNSFDIMFLQEKSNFYKLNLNFKNIFDLHDYLKKYNYILNLNSLKQKEIEKSMEISRPEYISGFQVSKAIQEFLITKDEKNIQPVIDHCTDGIIYLEKCLPIMEKIEPYINFSINKNVFKIDSFKFKNEFLYIFGTTDFNENIQINNFESTIQIENNNFTITIEVKFGEYSDHEKVIYTLNKNGELTNMSNIFSPPQIYLLYYKVPLWQNIIELSKSLISYAYTI